MQSESSKMQNILLLGVGGRESALAFKLSQSPLCNKLYIAAGNAGTGKYGQNIEVNPLDFVAVKQACLDFNISIVVPGPEDPLVLGIYDFIKNDPELKHIIVAGPSKAGAQLEGSKAFSKHFMEKYNIPTASYKEFTKGNYEKGIAWINQTEPPIVIKADGLAAGKGVVIAQSQEEARDAFKAMIMDEQFGAASSKVVIEQFLDGVELSVFALTDGKNYVILPEAKDYKRIGEGDKGLNTGGMGAISPVPFATPDFMQKVEERIVQPTVAGLYNEGIIYKGFIFFGLINVMGEPMVIEYNCRMGDPETEVVMPRLENDLVALIISMEAGKLNEVAIQHSPLAACTVMLVSGGYPGTYEKGKVISGLDKPMPSTVFHAGTKLGSAGEVLTNGGRVLAVTSTANTLKEALETSYASIKNISFDGMYYRTDIGWEF